MVFYEEVLKPLDFFRVGKFFSRKLSTIEKLPVQVINFLYIFAKVENVFRARSILSSSALNTGEPSRNRTAPELSGSTG